MCSIVSQVKDDDKEVPVTVITPLDRARRSQGIVWVTTHPILAGTAAGLVWGVGLRLWMRLIADRPEFTVGGSLFIIVGSGIVGAALGLAHRRRRANGAGYWRFSLLSLGLLGFGGAVMWPGVVAGAAAIARRRARRPAAVLTLLAVGSQLPVLWGQVLTAHHLVSVARAAAVVLYGAFLAFEMWAFSVVYRDRPVGAPAMGKLRSAVIWVPVVLVSVALALAGALAQGQM